MTNNSWSWTQGEVDVNNDYIRIIYGDISVVESDELVPAALISKEAAKTFIVEFIIPEGINNKIRKKILNEVTNEIEFYLILKDEDDPWEYAKYHCTTAANIYSNVHWGYFPKGYYEE